MCRHGGNCIADSRADHDKPAAPNPAQTSWSEYTDDEGVRTSDFRRKRLSDGDNMDETSEWTLRKRPRISCPEVLRLETLLEETQEKLQREVVLRRLLEDEAAQANKACTAYHELSLNFCAAFAAAEQEFERTCSVMRRNIADWESWGAQARAILEQHGLVAKDPEGGGAEDSCSAVSLGIDSESDYHCQSKPSI